jgi:hypothetical protein
LETIQASDKESKENRANGQSGQDFLLQSRNILEVPRTHAQAIGIDQSNENSNWKDSEAKEMKQLAEYQTFLDQGKDNTAPIGY